MDIVMRKKKNIMQSQWYAELVGISEKVRNFVFFIEKMPAAAAAAIL